MNTQKNQQGVAAIEFALIITVLLTVCFAIVSYGILMWTQQKVSHIAGDSARVGLMRSIQGHESGSNSDDAFSVCETYANVMAAENFLLSGLSCESITVTCTLGGVSGKCLQLTMKVPVSGLPLVDLVKALGNVISDNPEGWIPENLDLSATSIVKITEL